MDLLGVFVAELACGTAGLAADVDELVKHVEVFDAVEVARQGRPFQRRPPGRHHIEDLAEAEEVALGSAMHLFVHERRRTNARGVVRLQLEFRH